MRAIKLAKVAAQAERLRLQALAQRQVRRGVYGAVGAVFALGALTFAHVLAWLALVPPLGFMGATGVLLGVDLVIALACGALALYSKPGEVEVEAQRLKQRALRQVKEDMTLSALVPALGMVIGPRRARGGLMLAGLASRFLRRRSA